MELIVGMQEHQLLCGFTLIRSADICAKTFGEISILLCVPHFKQTFFLNILLFKPGSKVVKMEKTVQKTSFTSELHDLSVS